MDYKEIIESGKLELYALGALDANERQEVEALLNSSSELRNEYETIVETLHTYGKAVTGDAPAHILDNAKAEIESHIEDEKETTVVPIQKSSDLWRWTAIAASIILVISIGFNLKLSSDLSDLRVDYLALENEKQVLVSTTGQLNQQNQMIRSENDRTNELIAQISNGNISPVHMGSTENYSGYESTVYWDKTSSKVILATSELPELDKDSQYQLWAIVDGAPVDAGVFDSRDRLVEMKGIEGNAVAFAVTIEPKGGSENPTLEKMCMMGPVSG